MTHHRLQFENRSGNRLSARLDLPLDGHPTAYALFAHCFTCSKNFKAVANISKALTTQGIAVLRFDFTGLGESEGEFADTNFSSNVDDLVDAARFLEKKYLSPQVLIGHSLGGAAVLQAAGEIPSAKALVVIGAPAEPDHVLEHLKSDKDRIESKGEAEVSLAGRSFRIKKQFLDDLKAHRMADTIRNLRRSLLILHSPVDSTVGIENAASIFKSAKHPKSFVSLDQADHLLSDEVDSRYAGSLIAAWARKYMEVSEKSEAYQTDPSDNRVVVRTGSSGFETEILANGHRMVADEPVKAGGEDSGPTPYDYLVAGLGACTGMTLRMYADRKSWPLEGVEVRLAHRKIHADDCRNCETKSGYLDDIEREIVMEGPLDNDQKKRLVEIAERCPVHRTLKGEIRIRTHQARDGIKVR